jgi:hypothetical protein
LALWKKLVALFNFNRSFRWKAPPAFFYEMLSLLASHRFSIASVWKRSNKNSPPRVLGIILAGSVGSQQRKQTGKERKDLPKNTKTLPEQSGP